MKDPPDITTNYRTIKVPLKKVLKHYDIIQPKIESAVIRVNDFAFMGYEFLKLFLIDKFGKGEVLPKITKKLITNIFNTIGEKDSKRGRKAENKTDELKIFYDNTFSNIYRKKLCYSHLSYVLPVLAEEMVRCFETNIKTHFIDYLNKYINVSIRHPEKVLIKQTVTNKQERLDAYKKLTQDIKGIKNDLIMGKVEKSNQKYHTWVKEHIKLLLPDKIVKNVAYDVKATPQKYIASAFVINKRIEELGRRPYQVVPQRSNLVPKNITLNTSGIVEVLNDKNKDIYNIGYSEMSNNAKKYQKHTWQEILKLENKGIFKHKGYKFYNQIQTDGYSVSLLLIREDYYNKTYGKKMPKEGEEIDFVIKQLKDMTKDECDWLKSRKCVGIDPGKKQIISMIDDRGTCYSYSNARRRYETYGKRSCEIILRERTEKGVDKKEALLSKQTNRTCDFKKCFGYLEEKSKMIEDFKNFYERPLFRKLALRRFIKTQSAESKMLNEIEKKYGKDIVLGLGNWSNNVSKQMKGCMPSPNKGIYKLLSKRFDVVEVDEYKTSKTYHKDFTETLTNLKVKKGRKNKPIHALLTLTGTKNGVILNRDKNASYNIQYILHTYLQTQKRPEVFCRIMVDV
jgi:hypothetical protein